MEHALKAEQLHRLGRSWKGIAAAGVLTAAAGAGATMAWSAGLFGGGLSEANAAERAEAARRAEHEAFTEAYLAQQSLEVRVARGETLAGLLTRAGASPGEANAAIASLRGVFNPRLLQPGQPINLFFERGPERVELTGLAFRSQPGASITANRTFEGGFAAREVLMPLTYEIARIAAPVDATLYGTALQLGATDREVAALADAFAYDVDFQRDVHSGDHFELVFERFYDDEGRTVRTGQLLFVSLETRRGPRNFYSFVAPGEEKADWYDAEGKSARRFLMKTPVNGARLSSGFGMRRHPVLGYSRMHRGTDFAAPTGTPIMAAGDGVVVRAGPYGTYGNYVRIRHADGYETAYAHMSRFGRGVRSGTRVHQGQIIGYVGTTGRSTGPHLHYEVLRRGQQINPMSLRVAQGRNLTGRELELFVAERQRIDALREARVTEGEQTAAIIPASAPMAQN